MEKAGSKAIQHFSKENFATLNRAGFRYPLRLGPGVWHKQLFRGYSSKMDKRIEQLAKSDRSVILSFEKAYIAPDSLIHDLARHFDEMHVLFIAREPVSWVNSWMNQLIKAHKTPYKQCVSFSAASTSAREALVLDEHLARWERFAGPQRVTVIEFRKEVNVLDAYQDWLGLPEDVREAVHLPTEYPNEALDERGVRVFLEVKRLLVDSDLGTRVQAMKRAHDALPKILENDRPSTVRLIDSETARYVADHYRPHFEASLSKYGGLREEGFDTSAAESLLQKPVMTDVTPTDEEARIAREIVAG